MTQPRFAESKDAKDAGWFSRRHETREAHEAAVARYQHMRGRKARQRRAAERAA